LSFVVVISRRRRHQLHNKVYGFYQYAHASTSSRSSDSVRDSSTKTELNLPFTDESSKAGFKMVGLMMLLRQH
jgi:hypothetical protein